MVNASFGQVTCALYAFQWTRGRRPGRRSGNWEIRMQRIAHYGLMLVLFWPALAAATITNVAVDSTTATQAILRYTAPGASACSLQVSESASLQPLVHDVDPALFPGEDQDSRTGNLTSGRARVFVIGKRRADQGTDGNWYSRALQAYTQHYYLITCGTDTATGTFTTGNIALGNTYNEDLPADPNAGQSGYFVSGGQYAWPQFTNWVNTTGRSETVVDPQTGMLLKRVTMPQDQPTSNAPAGDHSFATAIDFDRAWTNPTQILADDNLSASYTGTNSDWLFLRDQDLVFGDVYPLESLTFSVLGWCSGPCVADNAKIQACITVNGVSCWPNSSNVQDVALGTTVNTSTFATAGSSVPLMAGWTPAGYPPLVRTDIEPVSGQVNVDTSGNVTWTGGSYFSVNWVAGSMITIAGSQCTLAGPAGAQWLSVNPASCSPILSVPQAGASYSAGNFGIMVRKKTSSTDTIYLQYAKYSITTSVLLGWPSSGSPQVCSDTLTQNTATGDLGYRCVINGGLPMVYWIDHITGDANYLGFLFYSSQSGPNGFQNGLCSNPASWTIAGTGPTDPEQMYCLGQDLSNNPIVLSCLLSSNNQPNNLGLSCSNMTSSATSSDLLSLIGEFTSGYSPSFNRSVFQNCSISGMQNGQLVIGCGELGSQQDTLAWVVVFNPTMIGTAAGCVGGGLPGCVVAASTTWSAAPARWCALHTLFIAGEPQVTAGERNIAWIAGKYFANPGIPGGGPYVSTVASGVLGSQPSIAAGSSGCPYGSAGCDLVTVDGEPCNKTPASIDADNCPQNASWGYLQNSAAGDVFQVSPGNNELVQLIQKTGNQWLLERGFGGVYPVSSHTGTIVLNEDCLAQRWDYGQSNTSWIWDFANDPHGTNSGGGTMGILDDWDHPFPRPNVVTGAVPFYNPGFVGGYGVSDGTNVLASLLAPNAYMGPPTVYEALGPSFAGSTGVTNYIESSQDHTSRPQDDAPSGETQWFLDARPAGTLGPSLADRAVPVSGQLYKFSSVTTDGDNLTQIGGPNANLNGVNRKLQATMAFCGTQPLTDVSSAATGNAISDSSVDSYHYCVSRNAGECRTGSARGDIYVNCPYAMPRSDGTYGCGASNDLCVYNTGAYLNGIAQIGYGKTDAEGKVGRLLTKGLIRQRLLDVNQNVRTLPDASWLLFRATALSGSDDTIMVGKMPPFPGPDSVSRGAFVPLVVNVNPPAGLGATNAILEFGYLEDGLPNQFYCTTRKETCVAMSATVGPIPFSFAGEGTGGTEAGLAGAACANGCSIAIPGLPQRVVYYRVKYRGANGLVLAQTPVQVASLP